MEEAVDTSLVAGTPEVEAVVTKAVEVRLPILLSPLCVFMISTPSHTLEFSWSSGVRAVVTTNLII
jgi:hypothetical protein